jgi:hypothetical protein
MLTWLADDPTLAYLILGLIAFGLGVGWWTNRGEEPGSMRIAAWLQSLKSRRLTRNQTCALGLAIAILLAIAVWQIGRVVVTDAKRIRFALEEMSAGVREKNVDKIFKQVSEKFKKGSRGKKEMRQWVEGHIRNEGVTRVNLSSLESPVISKEKGTATIKFVATPDGSLFSEGRGALVGYRCFATFVLDPDGEWRLQTFRVSLITVDPETGADLDLP